MWKAKYKSNLSPKPTSRHSKPGNAVQVRVETWPEVLSSMKIYLEEQYFIA
jgi:hypothetical protein